MTPTTDKQKQPSLFRNSIFRTIMLSQILLQLGIWVRNFAILLYVMEKTNNNAYAVGLISVAQFAPIFLFSLVGGTFADRWKPKRTMVWCDLLSAISVGMVLVAITLGSWKAIFFATLISAMLSQFSQPAALKLFKRYVAEAQLPTGMAMFQTTMAMFMVIGPIFGGFIYQRYGIEPAIGTMGICFLLSAVVLAGLPKDEVGVGKQTTTVRQELVAGLRYVWSKPVLRLLGAIMVIAGVVSGVLQPLGVFLVVERLGLPKEYLQWLLTTQGIAMLIGGGVMMGLAKKIAPPKMMAMGILASSVSALGMGMSTSLWLTLAMQFLNGLFFPCIHIGINTMILSNSEQSFVGRVNGVLTPLFMGMMVIMMSLAGWLKDMVGIVAIYETAGSFFLLAIIVLAPLLKGKAMVANSDARKA
ncbi:MFS transporter [Brevibacillus fluminis]|nr:MFS transporter [Brevibacillus fluminis]